jgi:hypothetical protein
MKIGLSNLELCTYRCDGQMKGGIRLGAYKVHEHA